MTPELAKKIVDAIVDGIKMCKHATVPGLEGAEITHAYCDTPEYPETTDQSRAAIMRLADGTWLALWDSEDYTGHGCRCDGGCSSHATQEEALRLGLGRDDRAHLEAVVS